MNAGAGPLLPAKEASELFNRIAGNIEKVMRGSRDARGDVPRRTDVHFACDAFFTGSARSACMPSCSFAASLLTSEG